MDMVDYRDEYSGLHRWTWWTTEMDMVDYTDGHGGLQTDMVDYTDGHGGLHRWT
jgi:hypothetical protein